MTRTFGWDAVDLLSAFLCLFVWCNFFVTFNRLFTRSTTKCDRDCFNLRLVRRAFQWTDSLNCMVAMGTSYSLLKNGETPRSCPEHTHGIYCLNVLSDPSSLSVQNRDSIYFMFTIFKNSACGEKHFFQNLKQVMCFWCCVIVFVCG